MEDSTGSNNTDLKSYLDGCTLNASPSGFADSSGSMPLNPTTEDVIIFHRNDVYKARQRQITINLLGLDGGRPYVNARLSRYSGETEIDWVGGSRPDGSKSTGRLQQTHAFPYLGRINGKINQYVFQTPPERDGSDDDVVKDISRDSKSVNDIMREVSGLTFAAGWCWIMIDAPSPKEDGDDFTIAEKDAGKIRPYWKVLSPLDVLDWSFNDRGELDWVKTQSFEKDDSNPFVISSTKRVVKLWTRGMCTKYTIIEKKDGRRRNGLHTQVEVEEIPLKDDKNNPLKVVPFVLCGDISDKPQAFDDLESINRTIMDLGSVSRANYFNCNYPQMVLPKSLTQSTMQNGYNNITEGIRLMLGFKYPIMLDKDDVAPSYLTPDSASLSGGAEIVIQLKRELFEVVGMSVESNSKQVASAEAKAWDFQDVSAVMQSRAETLEDAERRAVAISVAWDSGFQSWESKYNRQFDVGSFKDELATLITASNANLPDGIMRMIANKVVDRLDRIGSPTDPEILKVLQEEVANWNPNDFSAAPSF